MLVDSFALFPKIVAREDTILLCWAEYRTRINNEADWELYSMRSSDGGLTWSGKQRLSPPLFGGLFPAPILTAQGGANVLMTVLPPYPLPLGRMRMGCRTSFDGGRTWPDSTQVSYPQSYQPECPSIAADASGVLYGAWRSMQYRNWEIIFSRSTDGGHRWLGETRLTDELHESYDPAIAVAGSSLDVVWSDFRSGTWQTYSKRSSDGGIHWTPDSAVTSSTVGAILPVLVSSGDTLDLFWVDFRDGNAEIYRRSSSDGGGSWGPETRVTWDDSVSIRPAVAVNGQTTYLAWQDNRDGTWQIYFEKLEGFAERVEGLWGTGLNKKEDHQ